MDLFTSYKSWSIYAIVVFSMILITFGTVYAAAPDENNPGFNPWTPEGYKEVSVGLPSESTGVTAAPQADCILNTSGPFYSICQLITSANGMKMT